MQCRDYLLLAANQKLDADLQGKLSPSDIVQETFLEAQRDFTQFRGQGKDEWLGWLGQILAHNLANATRQFRATAMRDVRREVPLHGSDSNPATAPPLIVDTPSPSNKVIAREQQQALQQALTQLPDHYQEVLRLRYDQDLGFAEIGQALNCSSEAARKLWARAIHQLEQNLDAADAP
jgi:RNA polymerase sigma-70 factor (ECF subfamily)